MAITKIQSNAFPTSIDLSNVDLTLGAGEVLTANIADGNVTHAKLHTDMDLTSKTVVLPKLNHALQLEVSDNSEFLNVTITGNESWAFKGASGNGVMDYVSFGISGSTQAMAWQEDGNVGIGTTNPGYKLDVYNNTTDAGSQIRVKNQYTSIDADAIVNIDGYGASTLKLWRNGVEEWKLERITNTDNLGLYAYGGAVSGGAGVGLVQFWDYDTGNVGIGTSTPTSALMVNTPQVSSVADLLTLRDASAGTTFNLQTYSDPAYGTANRLDFNGAYLAFRRSGTEALRINSSSNVIVGATDIPNTGDSGTIAHTIATIPGTISAKGSIWSAPSIPSNKQVQADRWRFGGYTLQYHGGIDYRSDASYVQLILELPNGGPSGKSNLELFEIGFNYGWSSGFYMVEVFETYYVNGGYKMYQFNGGYNPSFNLHMNYGNNAISLDVLSEGTFANGTTGTSQSSTDNSYYRKTVRASYGAWHGGIVRVTIPSYCRFTDNGSEVNSSYQIRLLNPQ